ncbi:MAG: fasciclin [Pseudanabaena sp.]|nr:MAG: fasciclin [Pseudanabaena sp.]
MNLQQFPKLSVMLGGLAIATSSLFVSFPSFANSQKTTPTVQKVAAAPTKNIVEVAASNGSFNTLVAAVKAAGLVEVLSGKGPFTVFAPTDEAFAKLPKGTVETLLKPENKNILVMVLTYHVVSGKVNAKDIKAGSALVPTVEGSPIKVTKSRKGVIVIDNSKVIAADVKTSNGVIHVIDTVLLPPGLF